MKREMAKFSDRLNGIFRAQLTGVAAAVAYIRTHTHTLNDSRVWPKLVEREGGYETLKRNKV